MRTRRYRGIAYTDEGEGPALVLIHGFPLSRQAWRPQVEAFRDTHRVIAPDLPGFGDSDSPDGGGVSMEEYADEVAGLVESLDAGPAVVAGHSMGGYIALAFARRHLGLLRGLVLVATRAVADTPEAAAGRRSAADKVAKEGSEGVEGLAGGMLAKLLAPGADDPELLDAVGGFMRSASPQGVAGALLGMAQRADSTSLLPEIEVPTLVATGAEDTLIPVTDSETMAAAIPGAALAVLPRAGHMVTYEQPQAFNRELRRWLTANGL